MDIRDSSSNSDDYTNISSRLSSKSPLRREPTQSRGKQRVETILQAAAEVFLEVGFASATIDRIADRAQTAIGSLYRFFPDKLAIFHALEAKHKERIDAITQEFLGNAVDAPFGETISQMVDFYSKYFEDVQMRVVYLEYFLNPTPEQFRLFDGSFDRLLISQFARLLHQRNPSLDIDRSEAIAEVVHRTYNSILFVALRASDDLPEATLRDRRPQLYAELKTLLVGYVERYDLPLAQKRMICPCCHSQSTTKNGRKNGSQRYICKDCHKQFADDRQKQQQTSRQQERRQLCQQLHLQGSSQREIGRQLGVSHQTIRRWLAERRS
jgi:AcrR family transcriptional regulator